MFKTLYRCPRTIARHEDGPLYESRRAYLEHLAAQGSSHHTLRVAAAVIYRAAVHMRLDSVSPVERAEVERAARDWAYWPFREANSIGPDHAMKEFRLITCDWLRFAQRLREPTGPPIPHERELDAYCCYMDGDRGLSPATVATSRQQLIKFFHQAGQEAAQAIAGRRCGTLPCLAR
jgi:hypothetical protein